MVQIDVVRNQLGGTVNNMLLNNLVTPTQMRYILGVIMGEVAQMELSQLYHEQYSKQNMQEDSNADD